MSGIMSQLISIQPTVKRISLGYRKSPWGGVVYQEIIFARHWKFLQRQEKDFNRVWRNQNRNTSIKLVLEPNCFSTWDKPLLTLATVFNSNYRAKKNRSDKYQYTKDLDPVIDQNGLLRSGSRLLFAPTLLEKWPIILDLKERVARLYLEHAHRIFAHQATEPVKSFVQQRYQFVGLRKSLLLIKFRCFLCSRFDTQNIQWIMAPLPAFRCSPNVCSPTRLDLFGPFPIEVKQSKIEKHCGFICKCLVIFK